MKSCLPLSMLDNILDEQEKKRFLNYIKNLKENESQEITISKIKDLTDISEDKIIKAMLICYKSGVFNMDVVLRCPQCGGLIKKVNIDEIQRLYDINECYMCGEEIEVEDDDLVVIFSLKYDNNPFDKGQYNQEINKIVSNAAPYDTWKYMKIIADSIEGVFEIMQDKKDKDEKNERRQSEIKMKALRRYRLNKGIKILLNMIILMITIYCIYQIINEGDERDRTVLLTSVTYIVSYISGNIINNIICTDITMLEKRIGNKMA